MMVGKKKDVITQSRSCGHKINVLKVTTYLHSERSTISIVISHGDFSP